MYQPSPIARARLERLSLTLSTARAVLDPAKAHPQGWFLAADYDTIGLDVDHVEATSFDSST